MNADGINAHSFGVEYSPPTKATEARTFVQRVMLRTSVSFMGTVPYSPSISVFLRLELSAVSLRTISNPCTQWAGDC